MTEPEKPKNGNGWTDLLKTLAGGDNVSKIILVITMLLSGGNIWNTNREGDANRAQSEKALKVAMKQIRALYDNQRNWTLVVKGIKDDNNVLLAHFGLPSSKIPDIKPLPQSRPRDFDEEDDPK